MTLQTITVAGLSTSYADAQAGDLIPVERAGVMGKQTRAEFQTGLGLGTMSTQEATTVDIDGGTIDGTVIGGTTPAAGTFTTLAGTTVTASAGIVRASGTTAYLELEETDAPTTHRKTLILRGDNDVRFETYTNTLGFVSTDYEMALDANGAASHSWRVAGVERLLQTTNALRTNNIVPLSTGWNIGTANNGVTIVRFANIFLDNAPNVSSDARLKDNIADLTEAEKRAAAKIKARTFTMKGQKKVGYIAQEVIEAMASEGLCAFEYGLVTDGETYGVDMDAINAFRLG